MQKESIKLVFTLCIVAGPEISRLLCFSKSEVCKSIHRTMVGTVSKASDIIRYPEAALFWSPSKMTCHAGHR